MSKSDNKIRQNIVKSQDIPLLAQLHIATFQLYGTTFSELRTAQLACHIMEHCSELFPRTVTVTEAELICGDCR
jgi:hypothetical protein